MSFKKRRKSSRYRGTHTHGRGFKKKARGSGHRGGIGLAGTGKRGDAKKTLVINLTGGNNYFGKSKTLRRGVAPVRLETINVGKISENILSFVKEGIAKENKGVYEVDLEGYKILGEGETKLKMKIKANAVSESAHEKIKKAGGEVILLDVAEELKSREKKEIKDKK